MKNDDDETQMIVIRLPKGELKALDKQHLKGQRNEFVRNVIRDAVAQAGDQSQVEVSQKELKRKADDCRREMERLKRVLNVKFDYISQVALSSLPLEVENVEAIRQQLYGYSIRPEDGFDRGNLEDFDEYLDAWLTHDNLLREIDRNRKTTLKITEPNSPQPPTVNTEKKPQRYINPKERCCCRGHPHTREEHNRRCWYHHDMEMEIGINLIDRSANNPESHLRRIKEAGEEHGTSSEEKNMIVNYLKEHGTISQKTRINNYFFYHLFPVPFPECETNYQGKLVTEDLTCQEARSIILSKNDLECTEKRSKDNRLKRRPRYLDSLSDEQVVTKNDWGWMYTEEAQKLMKDHYPVEMIEQITNDREAWTDFNEEEVKILDAYLKAKNLPEPKFMGRGRFYTRNSTHHPSLSSHWETSYNGRRTRVVTIQGETKVRELEPWDEEEEAEANGLGFNSSGPIEPELRQKLERFKRHIYDEPEEEPEPECESNDSEDESTNDPDNEGNNEPDEEEET